MKSKHYARLILLLPYLSLVESIGYFRFHDYDYKDANVLANINFYWNFFAIFWFIPYTILTIYLLLWSRKKTIDEIKSTYTNAPIMLIIISTGVYFTFGVISFVFGIISYKHSSSNVGMGIPMIMMAAMAASIPASLIIGYACVGVTLVLGLRF